MTRRDLLRTIGLGAVAATWPGIAPAAPVRTRWTVRDSEGLDALSFLSPLSGDPFYLRYYEEDVAAFAPLMPSEAMDSLRALKARASQANILLSPFLDLRFSGGPDASIDDLLHSLDHADRVLRPPLEASPYWDDDGDEEWGHFLAAAPVLRSILTAMRDAGFAAFRSARFDPKAADRLPRLRTRLAGFDVVSEVEHFTGRNLHPEVEVVLLEFCKPHGIKVIGQKFLSAIDWPDEVAMRTAGHELLHPPVNMNGAAAAAALEVLRQDGLIQRIVEEHDPAFGYNSLEGLFDEDLASALDQLIGERAGVARNPAERWNYVDDGMHVLAAGLYGLMQRSGFARTGGNLEHFLLRLAKGGWLAPASLHGAAAQILGRPADRLWPLANTAQPTQG